MISIIVPVYNEESTIGPVLDELEALPLDKEVIVVDDASVDKTHAIVRAHGSGPIIERLHVNGGKGTAVRRGIELASGDIIVIQDADLELSPASIEALVQPIVDGTADAVFGSRFLAQAGRVPLTRRLANALLTRLTNLVYGTHLTDMETAHKAFRRSLLSDVLLTSERFEIEVELTAKIARSEARIVEVPTPYEPRSRSEGKKIKWRDGLQALWTIVKHARWRPSYEEAASLRNADSEEVAGLGER